MSDVITSSSGTQVCVALGDYDTKIDLGIRSPSGRFSTVRLSTDEARRVAAVLSESAFAADKGKRQSNGEG